MTDTAPKPSIAAAAQSQPEAPGGEGFAKKKTLGFGFWLSVGWLVLISVVAFLSGFEWFADLLSLDGEEEKVKDASGQFLISEAPSFDHPMGTDNLSRDVFSRAIYAARVSLIVGFTAIAVGLSVGGFFGILAGYFRGVIDAAVSFVFVCLLSFPALVLALLIVSVVDRSLTTIAGTLGILSIAPIGMLARAATLQVAERDFVLAAKTIGAKNGRIMLREILPNVLIPMAALALLGMAVAIVAEAGLAILGLSVPQGVTWGKLISAGAFGDALKDSPWISFGPIIMLFMTVLALNYAGDRIREYFDVKEISL